MRVLQIHERDLIPVGPGRAAPRTSAGGDRVGGLGAYLCAVFDALTDRGIELSTLAVGARTGVANPGMRYEEAESFRFRFDRHRHDAILAAAERARPDLVHLHAAYFTLHPRTAEAIQRRWPVVCTVHDVTTLCFRGDKCFRGDAPCTRRVGVGCVTSGCYRPGARLPPATDLLRIAGSGRVRAMYAAFDRVIAPSRFIRDVMVANGCLPGRVAVHPLFSRFETRAYEPTAMPTDGPAVILFAGRLDAGKGAEVFIDALSALPPGGWTAEIVGDGPVRAEIERRSEALRHRGQLILRGTLDQTNLEDAYRRARVVVFPSLVQESFGLIGLEAMSFARPVVAFPCGGVTDWLADGVNGLLARRGDAGDLARALHELVSDRARAETLGEAGRRRLLAEFTRQRHTDSLVETYEQALAERAR